MRLLVPLAIFESRGLIHRRWVQAVLVVGIASVVLIAAVAASHTPAVERDSYRGGAASLLLLGGLVLAVGLGSTTIGRSPESGHLGLLAGSGAPRALIAAGRTIARVCVLLAILGVWCLALQIGSIAAGLGNDGPLAVHGAATLETAALVLLAAAAVSTVLGPVVAGIVALFVHTLAQATVNLEAAADQGRLGSGAQLAHVAYNTLPRAVVSPMIVDLQNRGQGGAAAPRFEINELPVPIAASGVGTVLWTLFWCGLFAALCVSGTVRRNL